MDNGSNPKRNINEGGIRMFKGFHRNHFVSVICAIIAVGLLSTTVLGANEKIVLRLGAQCPATDESPEHKALLTFKRFVEAESGGRVEIKYYPASQLGYEREMLEAVKMGTLDMTMIAEGPISGFYPTVYVLSIPYLFSDSAVAWKVLDGPFGQELAEDMREKMGVMVLGYGENGFRHFTNNQRRVTKLEDLKGLKIRVMESPLYIELVRALGALPTPMSGGGELYNAMQQKVVDGQENPLDQIYTFRFYEVQKYVVIDGHTYSPHFLLINENRFNSLPKEVQTILKHGGHVFSAAERGMKRELDLRSKELLEEKGMIVDALSEEEKARFREATQGPVIEWMESKVDRVWIDKALKAAEEVEANF